MYTRSQPYLSRIQERTPLSGLLSTKKTVHIVLENKNSALSFKVGDSIGVLPTNDPVLVDRILDKIGSPPALLREELLHKVNLSKTRPQPHLSVLDFVAPHMDVATLKKAFLPLLPRFYSIASAPSVFPHEIHLTVAHLSYMVGGEKRWGVGSHFLCEQAKPQETPIPIYVQPSTHFTLPKDKTTPIILIGPGTGVAPFRAFLQERLETGATGRNWLFFGERNRNEDFYYSDFFLKLEKQNLLQLDLAFSRDQDEQIYVQHKMLEKKKSLWNWIENGALLYVCGDAEKMAKDVETTLLKIIKEEGNFTEEEARLHLKKMKAEKRYLADVY